MADYIYLLETRLSPAQQRAIGTIRTIARENDITIFLTGGAVRDLTGGGSIRDLDMTVQGAVLPLKGALEKAGAQINGEKSDAQKLFLVLPGGVRVELSTAVALSYPQPGKPKYEAGTLSDDLRSRDFTANAMAISLNDGSYGLLIDPLNGVADIENRELRLVSNYGFIEDPSRLIRAARLGSRLGWQMEERTRQRYDTAKEEGYISALAPWNRGYELEEIFHEEDPVRILRALEAEGWMVSLFPALGSARANTVALADLAERQGQLQTQGIFAQSAALLFPLVTAKMSAPDLAALRAALVRPGFTREIDTLESRTREFGARFASKEAAAPSAAWKMLHETEPNLVLSLANSSKTAAVQTRLKTFLTESPTARQRLPYAVMQEMRITPDLPVYADLLEKLFFELMDGKLSTPEEMKAYLEPYSPPAPPPPVNLRRARAKKEARPSRAKAKKEAAATPALSTVAAEEEAAGLASGLTDVGSLTGPDRGTEPTPQVPMEGKVAPEPVAASRPRPKKPVAAPVETAATPAPDKKSTPEAIVAVPAKSAAKPKETAKQPQVVVVSPPKAQPSAARTVPVAKPAPTKTPVKTVAAPSKVGKAALVVKKPVKHAAVPVKSPHGKGAVTAKKAAPPVKAATAKKAVPAKKAHPVKAGAGTSAAGKAPATKVPATKAAATKTPAKKSPATKAAAPKAAGKKLPAKKTSGRR